MDLDEDTLTFAQELFLGSDDELVDTDGDGISDADEVFIYQTDPISGNFQNEVIVEQTKVAFSTAEPAEPESENIFTDGFDDHEDELKREFAEGKWDVVTTTWGETEVQNNYVELAAHNGITSIARSETLDKGI